MNGTPITTASSAQPALHASRELLSELYQRIRDQSVALCSPLAPEDMVVQSMPDASPSKWHLAHTSWFFETFVLRPALPDYRALDERYAYLFNSYYEGVGAQFPRAQRGLLSRPTVSEVLAYRHAVDAGMAGFFRNASDELFQRYALVIEVGINHEEQHQELMVTDIKTVLCDNPLGPIYAPEPVPASGPTPPLAWLGFGGGLVELGNADAGFAFDNERPRHRVYLEPFELATRPVTWKEYLEFVEDGGYERPELWLSDGWACAKREAWRLPMYAREASGAGRASGGPADTRIATLSGERAVDLREPVCHVSFYEADAFSRWAGARLPTEAEWEIFAPSPPVTGNFLESGRYHPQPLIASQAAQAPSQMFGDVWEWTLSPYAPYPGYRPFSGVLGEYNGKFMCNQMVLRGGSCATPLRHLRATYRNFFPPAARWQFTGIRLAR